MRHYAGDRFDVYSAGLEPKGIHPLTIEVMEEIGIPMEGHYSKSSGDFLAKVPVNYVIIVCERAEASCPKIWPFGAKVLSWPFEDPVAFQGSPEACQEKFRAVRDEIDHRIQQWLLEV